MKRLLLRCRPRIQDSQLLRFKSAVPQPNFTPEFDRWEKDSLVSMVRNPDDFEKGLPYFDRLNLYLGWVHSPYVRNWSPNISSEGLARDRVRAFLFATVPLKFTGGLGSPVTPLASA